MLKVKLIARNVCRTETLFYLCGVDGADGKPNQFRRTTKATFEMMNLNVPQAYAVEHASDIMAGAAVIVRGMDVADGVFVSYRANAVEGLERTAKRLANIAQNLRIEDCALALSLDAKGMAEQSAIALDSLADYSEDVASDVELIRAMYAQASRLLS